jgi:hypothetical protein
MLFKAKFPGSFFSRCRKRRRTKKGSSIEIRSSTPRRWPPLVKPSSNTAVASSAEKLTLYFWSPQISPTLSKLRKPRRVGTAQSPSRFGPGWCNQPRRRSALRRKALLFPAIRFGSKPRTRPIPRRSHGFGS